MSKLAFTTFSVFPEPKEHPSHATFWEQGLLVFSQLKSSSGFKDAAAFLDDRIVVMSSEKNRSRWGEGVNPKFVGTSLDISGLPSALTLSIWESIEAVKSFTYSGAHDTALHRRKEWFVSPQWPNYAMWWIDDETQPTFAAASERLETLHTQGSTSFAFDFKRPFSRDVVIDDTAEVKKGRLV